MRHEIIFNNNNEKFEIDTWSMLPGVASFFIILLIATTISI